MRLIHISGHVFAGVLLASAVASCALLDKTQKIVTRGSSGSSSELEASDTERMPVADVSVADGPVLTPPKEKSKKKSPASTPSPSGKAVKNKKQKKDGTGVSEGNTVSVKELDEARREAALEEREASETVAATGDGPRPAVARALPSDFSINGEWTVASVRGNAVTGEERPYVTFDVAAGRFYGSNGCNYVNGDLSVDGGSGTLVLGEMIATMRMCDDAPYEYLINLALSDVKSYAARQEGSITYLDLKGREGNVVMVLRRHNMDFLNGAWRIKELNGTPMGEQASITIDVTDLKIHGNTGCNIFNGTLFIDPDKTDSVQFADLITTRMSCPDNVRETELLLALEEVETARLTEKDIVEMWSASGVLLFTLERIPMDTAR